MTTFVKIPGGALLVEGHDSLPSTLRPELATWLVDQGVSPFDADTIAGRAAIGQTWWSDQYRGQTHDCAEHGPERGPGCFPDARPVTAIGGVGGWD